jgi:hypothetical protein
MSELEEKVRKAAFTYLCHVKSHELQLPFDEFWQAMRPSEPAPPLPNWPPELSRNLLVGMRQENEFIDALCLKYELG